MARTGSLKLNGADPTVIGPHIFTGEPPPEQTGNRSIQDGALKIDHPDGTTTIDFNTSTLDEDKDDTGFGANLAKKIDSSELSSIASNLLEGIDRDELSRKDWLETRAMGIDLLGLKLEKPRSDAGQSSAPLEGMSSVRHPLLLEATVSFQATARAELLPAAGPVKVRNDSPYPPSAVVAASLPQAPPAPPQGGPQPQPPPAPGTAPQTAPPVAPPAPPPPDSGDDLAHALETDLNHYLTAVATEYVPDTDRMLFYVGFGGDGFKKVYNCPLRRRPVSESVDAEDLIVSNAATDLQNCGRVTHRIRMRQSTLKRMQILGVYREVDLAPPATPSAKNPVDKKKDAVAGVNLSVQRPEDRDYEIFEIYCELDLDEFAPKQFKGKGLPLPYRVTLEKESRQILDIRRNWKDDDKECCAKKYFVQFPMIRGLGFYGLGYIHLLGNTTVALTGAWRMQLDCGMFASFPGFIYDKGLGRQLTNQFRVPPGGGIGLEVPMQKRLQDSVMPLPYKDVGAGFTAFMTHVEEVGHRLASTANIQVGEGKQDAPVGTTLALIEQASKVLDSAHKRLHAAQAEEFALLKERFQEDPEAFWRHNPKTTIKWEKDQFIKALNNHKIVPVADPNNPTQLHRMAKGMAVKELQKATPELYDKKGVDMWVLRNADINPEGLFLPVPAQVPPDPRLVAIKEKAASSDKQNQIQLLEARIKAATAHDQMQDKSQDRQSREKIEMMKIELEHLKIQEEQLIHSRDAQKEAESHVLKMGMEANAQHQQLQMDAQAKAHELHHDNMGRVNEAQVNQISQQHDIEQAKQKHQADLAQGQMAHEAEMNRMHEKHSQELRHAQAMNDAKVEAAKKMATIAKRDKSKPTAKKGK